MNATDSVSDIRGGVPRVDSLGSDLGDRAPWGVSKSHAQRAEHHPTPWWLWWNILSLDAPTVAVVWARLLARPSHVRLVAADEIILSLVVWTIYVTDRLLDGWKATNQTALHERHLFCAKHRVALACLVVLAAAAVLWGTAEYLAPLEASAGIKLAAVVGAYMISIHGGRGSMARFVPKEVAVGILFAAGTTLPVWSRVAEFSLDLCVPFGLFAVLCSLNCLAIECWENHLSDANWYQARGQVIRWAEASISRIAAALAISSFALLFLRQDDGPFGSELLAISLAALLILLLNRHRDRLSGRALRVLADVVLVIAGLIALMSRI
jgi:hypothetical protein